MVRGGWCAGVWWGGVCGVVCVWGVGSPTRESSQLGVGSQGSGHPQGPQAPELWAGRPGAIEGPEGRVADQGEGTGQGGAHVGLLSRHPEQTAWWGRSQRRERCTLGW